MKNKKIKGSFLIDILIGLAVSSFVIVTVMTIYSTFEEDKITNQNISNSLFNLAIASTKMSSIAKNAGYGINNFSVLGCNVRAFNQAQGDFTFTLSPVLINNTDPSRNEITFVSGDSRKSFVSSSLIEQKPSGQEFIRLDTRFGFELGDLLVIGQIGQDCSLHQISAIPGNVGNTNQILLTNTSFVNPLTNTLEPITYHKVGGFGINYNTNAAVMNIGKNTSIIRYFINNQNQLVEENFLTNQQNIIANDIIGLQSLYGIDTNNDKSVDSWVTNVANNQMPNILGIRVAILTRTNLQSKKENGACNTTLNSDIDWLSGSFDVSGIADWQCYRYRVLQTTLPLKNMIWN